LTNDDLERRLRRVEELLNDVVNRLVAIEELLKSLGISSEEVVIAEELVMALSLPAVVATKAAERVVKVVRGVREGIDPISRAVIEVLSSCEELSTSEITRRVRLLRGTASRRIVRDRLLKLAERGVVLNVGSESRPKYVLKVCIEESR